VEKTSSGLQENVASFLCYLFTWLSGVIFLLVEPANKNVRFHAIQSICFTVAAGVLSILVFILALILAILVSWLATILWLAFGLLVFIVWILLMVRAYQGQQWRLPIIGDMAAKWAGI
jgi:uncharacterized membrane protein